MKHLLLAAAIALAGCTPASVNAPPPSAIADTVVLEGTRALVLAEYAYEAARTSALGLVRAGLIHGQTATQLRAINASAIGVLRQGKAARDAASRAAAARSLFDLVDQLNTIISKA